MIRLALIFVVIANIVAWSLALLFVYALVFNPELIGATVARIILGFQQTFGGIND